MPAAAVDPHLAAYRRRYDADPLTGTVGLSGRARRRSRALAAAGHGLAVCTQKADAPARAILAGLGLMPPITGFTGGDSLPGVLKPDPRIFRHAADQLRARPRDHDRRQRDRRRDRARRRRAVPAAPAAATTIRAPDSLGAAGDLRRLRRAAGPRRRDPRPRVGDRAMTAARYRPIPQSRPAAARRARCRSPAARSGSTGSPCIARDAPPRLIPAADLPAASARAA